MDVVTKRLERYMPTEVPMYRNTDFDLEWWARDGVKAIVWDVEATLGATGAEELELPLVARVHEAHDLGIQNAIETNHPIKTKRDRNLLAGWGEQTRADLVLWPIGPERRKPGIYMHEQAMNYFQLEPHQMGGVGDKATADMLAAWWAGFEHRAWTRSIEGNQHPGDVLLRRPFEVLLRLHAHLELGEPAELAKTLWTPDRELDELILPGEPDGLDKVIGFGIPDILLDNEALARLKTPLYRQAMTELQKFALQHTETPRKALEAFLYEHGREVATVLTYSRVLIAAGIVATSMSYLDKETKRKINTTLITVAYLTDYLDGKASRADKDGPTAEGARADQTIDKLLSAAVDLFALLPEGAISELEALIPIGRDAAMTKLRKIVLEHGMDTKSVAAGKRATAAKGLAQLLGLTLGYRNPDANKVLQATAMTLKLTSAVDSIDAWLEATEFRQHEHNNLARLAA